MSERINNLLSVMLAESAKREALAEFFLVDRILQPRRMIILTARQALAAKHLPHSCLAVTVDTGNADTFIGVGRPNAPCIRSDRRRSRHAGPAPGTAILPTAARSALQSRSRAGTCVRSIRFSA